MGVLGQGPPALFLACLDRFKECPLLGLEPSRDPDKGADMTPCPGSHSGQCGTQERWDSRQWTQVGDPLYPSLKGCRGHRTS